jgi:hypothetical protein
MEKTKNIALRREFLNEDPRTSLTSMIGYCVTLETWNDELIALDLYDRVYIDFSMTDCNRKISLEFSVDSKKDMRNSLHKLNTIITMCELMKEDLKTARTAYLTAQAKLKEIKK